MSVWRPGETVGLWEVWRDRLWSARPAIVAADDGDALALWLPRGTRWKAPVTPPHRSRAATRAERLMACLEREDWVLDDRVWDISTLWLLREGDLHATWVSWLPDGEHYGWYINLQEPYRRTARGLHWMDLMLDVVVAPDRSWRWKDEDEFQALIDHRLIDETKARAVREAAATAIRQLEAGEPPFCTPWPAWRPDPAWPAPVLPPDWETL
jgi:predicted RNA-binding protein associated with RNAse of E/G family